MSEATYGTGLAAERRRWLHKRLAEMRDGDELPTTVSSLYYDGVQQGRWPSDAEAKDAGRKRTPRQDVSDAVQWLIERDLVDFDAIVDISRGVLDHRRPTTSAPRRTSTPRRWSCHRGPPTSRPASSSPRSLSSALAGLQAVRHRPRPAGGDERAHFPALRRRRHHHRALADRLPRRLEPCRLRHRAQRPRAR